VRKRIVNFLKYALAIALMTWVVWSNWGDPRGTAGKIIVGSTVGPGKVSGTVVDYQPDSYLRIRENTGDETTFALKPGGKTKVVNAEDAPLTEGESVKPGEAVTVAEVSRGLAYVWQRNVLDRQPIHAGYLALAFGFGLTALLLTFVRWYILVRAVDLPFRLVDAIRLGFIGFFFNTLMPGSVGGDAIKAWFLAREQSRRTTAVATVIMDRVLALWALIWFVALLGAAFWIGGMLEGDGAAQCRQVVTIAGVIVGSTFAGWLVLGLVPDSRAEMFAARLAKLPKIGHAASEFWRAVWVYHRQPKIVFGVLVFTWLSHIGFVLAYYCSMRTLWDEGSGQQVPTLVQHFLIVPIGMVIQATPLFPGGAGIGELGYGLLYQWLGCSEASGVLGSLVQRVLYWVIGLMGYVVYLRMRTALPTDQTAVELAAAEA
jgi:uncharacterized membrane protein YbhN (UPF0104 family)